MNSALAHRKSKLLAPAEQLEITGQTDFLELPYHQAILNNEIPLSTGGGIGQSRTMMLLPRKPCPL